MILVPSLDTVVTNGARVLVHPQPPRVSEAQLVQPTLHQSGYLLLVLRVVVFGYLLRVQFARLVEIAEDSPGVPDVGHPEMAVFENQCYHWREGEVGKGGRGKGKGEEEGKGRGEVGERGEDEERGEGRERG